MASFTSVGRNTSTQGILLWLNRNSVSTTNQSPADAWRAYLEGQVGTAGQEGKRDLERVWLRQRIAALGATVHDDGLSGLWSQYLVKKGHTGSLDDMFIQWIDHGTP